MKAATPRGSAERALPLLAWLIASCASAALAHALIGMAGQLGWGGSDYDGRDHGSVGPVAVAAVALIAFGFLAVALRKASGVAGLDPIVLLTRRLRRLDPVLPCCAVAFGCAASLLGMEFAEQLSVYGHIAGVADALGGNPVTGAFSVLLSALAVSLAGLGSASALAESALATGALLTSWFREERAVALDCSARSRRTAAGRRRHDRVLARSAGLRAPPHAA
jgi:hypothetical protein